MAIIFASLLTLVFTDRVSKGGSRFFLILLNAAAMWSVWNMTYGHHDLRPYIVVQFGSLLALIFIVIFFKYGRLARSHLLIAAALYAIAKAFEVYDHQVFELLGFVSGHSLKHLAAAGAILAINTGVKEEPWRP